MKMTVAKCQWTTAKELRGRRPSKLKQMIKRVQARGVRRQAAKAIEDQLPGRSRYDFTWAEDERPFYESSEAIRKAGFAGFPEYLRSLDSYDFWSWMSRMVPG